MRKKVIKAISALMLALAMLMATPNVADAQCPMCRMSAENNLKAGGTAAKGLNNGILFMLAAPYLLVGGLGYVWWRNRRRKEEEDANEDAEVYSEENFSMN